jgi:DNA-binding CsgD family transcriptional regulator
MKFKSSQEFTYLGYLHNTWYDKHETDEQEIFPLFQQFKQLAGPVMGLMPMFFVLDYSCKKYSVFTESIKHILGYDARELLECGIEFTLQIIQPDFFKTLDQKAFPATLDFLKKVPQHDHGNYVFSFNSQFRTHDGKYINTLQKSIYLTAQDTGLPRYCIGMVTDINAYKKDSVMIHQVEKFDAASNTFNIEERNYFYPFAEDALLTKQEKNIVKYIADGLSSKMIADKLKISENTITNHRVNMMRKTNTKNVAQLIAFVAKNHII